jgi:hypothetical protein
MTAEPAGGTVVRDVRVERREDAFGEEALFIVLVLADPPDGVETWPVNDLRTLRRRVREHLSEKVDDRVPWFVVFEPEHPDLEDEEQFDLDL